MLKGGDILAAQIMETLIISEISKDNYDIVNEYKKAKGEVKRLGFSNYEEYTDHLDFMKIRSKQTEKTLVGQI